eukprot:TRINITY_DN10151_c0_g1_i1.p1 TRINITY_DN10151_c0_g1~~TRINITY_DN10151_c0_g1_i1.p1  ORF type:complete len:926 (+),score=223.44 TRINITY_DN10151_c0_g1_i1:62-2839(+)
MAAARGERWTLEWVQSLCGRGGTAALNTPQRVADAAQRAAVSAYGAAGCTDAELGRLTAQATCGVYDTPILCSRGLGGVTDPSMTTSALQAVGEHAAAHLPWDAFGAEGVAAFCRSHAALRLWPGDALLQQLHRRLGELGDAAPLPPLVAACAALLKVEKHNYNYGRQPGELLPPRVTEPLIRRLAVEGAAGAGHLDAAAALWIAGQLMAGAAAKGDRGEWGRCRAAWDHVCADAAALDAAGWCGPSVSEALRAAALDRWLPGAEGEDVSAESLAGALAGPCAALASSDGIALADLGSCALGLAHHAAQAHVNAAAEAICTAASRAVARQMAEPFGPPPVPEWTGPSKGQWEAERDVRVDRPQRVHHSAESADDERRAPAAPSATLRRSDTRRGGDAIFCAQGIMELKPRLRPAHLAHAASTALQDLAEALLKVEVPPNPTVLAGVRPVGEDVGATVVASGMQVFAKAAKSEPGSELARVCQRLHRFLGTQCERIKFREKLNDRYLLGVASCVSGMGVSPDALRHLCAEIAKRGAAGSVDLGLLSRQVSDGVCQMQGPGVTHSSLFLEVVTPRCIERLGAPDCNARDAGQLLRAAREAARQGCGLPDPRPLCAAAAGAPCFTAPRAPLHALVQAAWACEGLLAMHGAAEAQGRALSALTDVAVRRLCAGADQLRYGALAALPHHQRPFRVHAGAHVLLALKLLTKTYFGAPGAKPPREARDALLALSPEVVQVLKASTAATASRPLTDGRSPTMLVALCLRSLGGVPEARGLIEGVAAHFAAHGGASREAASRFVVSLARARAEAPPVLLNAAAAVLATDGWPQSWSVEMIERTAWAFTLCVPREQRRGSRELQHVLRSAGVALVRRGDLPLLGTTGLQRICWAFCATRTPESAVLRALYACAGSADWGMRPSAQPPRGGRGAAS